jgi:hypothetical protein
MRSSFAAVVLPTGCFLLATQRATSAAVRSCSGCSATLPWRGRCSGLWPTGSLTRSLQKMAAAAAVACRSQRLRCDLWWDIFVFIAEEPVLGSRACADERHAGYMLAASSKASCPQPAGARKVSCAVCM